MYTLQLFSDKEALRLRLLSQFVLAMYTYLSNSVDSIITHYAFSRRF